MMANIDCIDYACGSARPRRLSIIDQASRAPHKPWFDRLDFFWDPLFEFQPRWRPNGHSIERLVLNRRGEQVKELAWEPSFTPLGSRLLRYSHHVRGVVAALFGFHQLTAGQLAAHLGHDPSTISRILKPMFEAGLVERAQYAERCWHRKVDNVYRLRRDEPLERFLAGLDEAEQIAITLGLGLDHVGPWVRHNLMLADLVLRLEETAAGPLQAVFGERFASSDRLLPGLPARRVIFGDACVVRGDGLRIVIELVRRQRDRDVEEKMKAWGRLLSEAPWTTTGTVVIFVNASSPGRAHHDRATSLRRCHARALSPEGLSTNIQGCQNARSSVYVSSLEEWFPRPWSISSDFTHLVVGYTTDGRTWHRAALFPGELDNVIPFRPGQPEAWTKPSRVVVDPAGAAGILPSGGLAYYGTPNWLNGPIATSCSPATAALRTGASDL